MMSNTIKTIEGGRVSRKTRFALVASRFNEDVMRGLIDGASSALREHRVPEENLRLVRVPGAVELPLVAKQLASNARCEGIVALGAVIRGETPHFDYISSACAHGLNRVMLETGIPIGFGVLTCDTVAQALERANSGPRNKGVEAALATLEMVALLPQLDE